MWWCMPQFQHLRGTGRKTHFSVSYLYIASSRAAYATLDPVWKNKEGRKAGRMQGKKKEIGRVYSLVFLGSISSTSRGKKPVETEFS